MVFDLILSTSFPKVLFVYKGYGKNLENSVVDFQRMSLVQCGLIVDKFPLETSGLFSYLHAWWCLFRFLRTHHYDIIHAHYSFSGIVARLATTRPVVCSLMGSDMLQMNNFFKLVTQFFTKYLWSLTIVKNSELQKKLKGTLLLSNGVDMNNFKPIDRQIALQHTGFNPQEKNIIFVAVNPYSYVKNLSLAERSIQRLKNPSIRLHLISRKSFIDLPYYYSSADLLLLTSLSEGSPNVVKEAMACNCPIVATNVGDIKIIAGNTTGVYICSFDELEVAEGIKSAIEFGKRTYGRQNIQELDSSLIARRLINHYMTITR